MDIHRLERAIENDDVEEASRLLNEISPEQDQDAVPILIKHIIQTPNMILRNALAMVLRDIGNEEAVSPLIDLINDPKTLGSRGTLLYALKPFDCRELRNIHVFSTVIDGVSNNFLLEKVVFKSYVRIISFNNLN